MWLGLKCIDMASKTHECNDLNVWGSRAIGRKAHWVYRLNFSFSAMETVCFTIGAPTTDHNVKKAKETLVINMCDVLSLHPSEICLVGSQEKGDNWFNLTFELPRRSELLGKLRWAAINKDPRLILCGVKAVAIGSEDQIVIQPIPRSLPLANPAGELSQI